LKALAWSFIPGDLIRFLHGVRKGKWHGSGGTLTDYLLEKDTGMGVPIRVSLTRWRTHLAVPGFRAKCG
jgi:hypothetical protein